MNIALHFKHPFALNSKSVHSPDGWQESQAKIPRGSDLLSSCLNAASAIRDPACPRWPGCTRAFFTFHRTAVQKLLRGEEDDRGEGVQGPSGDDGMAGSQARLCPQFVPGLRHLAGTSSESMNPARDRMGTS
jgi:hypothetical protein